MLEIGLSSKSNPFTDELFSSYVDAGIRIMEVSRCTEGYDGVDFAGLADMAARAGVTLRSLHLPFKPYLDFDISNPACAERAVEYNKEIIAAGVNIGIKVFVIHPSGINIDPKERPLRIATVAASLAALAEFASSKGARIAVENMAHDCIGNTIEELDVLVKAHPDLCVCFDVNHLLHESHEAFVHHFGKRIITTHISDCDLVNERHWMPGEGCIDFDRLLRALIEVGYDGPLLYEVTYKVPTVDGYYTTLDFAENAKAIFGYPWIG